jgi:hypothetical protein
MEEAEKINITSVDNQIWPKSILELAPSSLATLWNSIKRHKNSTIGFQRDKTTLTSYKINGK